MLLIFAKGAAAVTVQILDQYNKPVPNAVVSVAGNAENEADISEIAIMDQINQQFSPHVLVIQQGQYVSFPNSDDIRHHVYSFSAVNPFEIKLYKGQTQAPILFDKAGIGVLGCNIHDNMVGYIYISHEETAKVTDENGEAVFNSLPVTQVSVWHPQLQAGATERVQINLVEKQQRMQGTIEIEMPVESPQKNTFGSRKFGQKG